MEPLAKKILLVRHGATAYNEADLLQGRIDNPLSPRGRAEAERLAERLRGEAIDAVFSSPLRRALETAEIINRFHGREIVQVPEFSEIDLGEWEGLSYGRVKDLYAEAHQRWLDDPDTPVPGGESFRAVCERVRPGLERALADGHAAILISGHASANRAILAGLLGLAPAQARAFRSGNAALSQLVLYAGNGRRRAALDFWNSTSHLDPNP